MPSGEGNAGERWKKTIGLISKKAALHVQHTFFVYFFAVVLHDFNVKIPETFLSKRFLEEMSLPLIFTLHMWPLAFLILSSPLQNFHVVRPPPQKIYLLFFFSLSRCTPLLPFFSLSFAGLPRTFSFSLSFSCSIFQICGHDNWSIKLNQHRYRNNFRFPFSSSLTL